MVSHTELLVAALIKHTEPYGPDNQGLKTLKALQAVIELHRPEEQDHKQYKKCWNCNLVYPCPTIQAIEKELE